MGMERWWYAREPGQRTWVSSRHERCEAPVEDGRHITRGSEAASAGSCQQVAERVFTSFGGEGEQVGSQGWPSSLVGESWDVVVGLVELCNGLRSDELFGCHVEAVGVALDRLESRAAGSLSSRSTVLAETGASSRAMIWCSVSVGVRGEIVSGRMRVWGSPSPTTWR
jgi:hypothetical protein